MSYDKVPFHKEIEVYVSDNIYYATVEGHLLRDEYDDYKTYTAITKINVVDEQDNSVDLKTNADGPEIIQEIMGKDYEVEYEEEGLESWHDCLD